MILSVAFSCKDDEVLKSPPTVLYPSEELVINLNNAGIPSIICVVNSEEGLKTVEMFIVKKNAEDKLTEEQLDRPVTSFYNPTTYSVNQTTSFTEDMVAFKLVATDRSGQVTISQLPIKVIPVIGLPNAYFSSDKEGSNKMNSIVYVEDDPMPDVFVNVSSEEELNYLVLFQTTEYGTTRINDTIFFRNSEKSAVINLKTWESGESYIFEKGTTAIRAKVSAGELNKNRETFLVVDYKHAVSLTLNENSEFYNGIKNGQVYSFSGNISSANALNRFTYRMVKRDGSVSKDNTNISIGADGKFKVDFTAENNLGSIIIEAENSAGKVNSRTLEMHVGYKYYYLFASLAAAKNTDFSSGTGPIFSAELGNIFTFCAGKEQYQSMDVGFAIWNNNKNIRLTSLETKSKFDSGTGTCSPVGTYPDAWPGRNTYTIGKSAVKWNDFEKATIDDFKTEPIIIESTEGVTVFTNMTTVPIPMNVAVYEAIIKGQPKRVLITVDSVVKHEQKTPGNSTIMAKIKVEL